MIPFTFEWCKHHMIKYAQYMVIKGKKYKKIRYEIQNQLKYSIFKMPLERIIILKNYYSKNRIIICIKPFLSSKMLIIDKLRNTNGVNKIQYKELDKSINVYDYFKKDKRFD